MSLRFYCLLVCLPDTLQLTRNFLLKTCFHSCILPFSAWSSWAAICLIAASADLLALVVPRVSCLNFNRFAALPLVALRTLRFTDWFLSASTPNWREISWRSASYSCLSTFEAVTSHASDASFSMSSILQLLSAYALLKMTSKFSKMMYNLIPQYFTRSKIDYQISIWFSR